MKRLIEALQFILQFMKDPECKFPTACAHDVLYIWGVDLPKMTAEDVKKLDDMGFNVGFEEERFIEECFGNDDYAWKDLTEEIWDKMKDSLSDCLYSYRYGSC